MSEYDVNPEEAFEVDKYQNKILNEKLIEDAEKIAEKMEDWFEYIYPKGLNRPYKEDAATIRALIALVKDKESMVSVPVEPTDEMVACGMCAHPKDKQRYSSDEVISVYKAMIAARKET